MESKKLTPAEPLIPHRRGMRLIAGVKNPTADSLQAEALVSEAWPLQTEGTVSPLLGLELVAQTVSALSTLSRGEGAGPKVGWVVGVKEAEFCETRIPVGTRLAVRVRKVSRIGGYAVIEGRVDSDSALICRVVLQVMEPEEEIKPAAEQGGPWTAGRK